MRLAGHYAETDGRQICKRSHKLDANRLQETKRKTAKKTWRTTFTEDVQGFGVKWRGAKKI